MALSTDQYGYLIDPLVPITDDTGRTIKDGFIRVYIAGSSTPVITYRNYDGAVNEHTIELDNSGRCKHPVIVSKSLAYKVVVYDAQHSQETPIITVDKLFAIGASVTAGAGATVVTGIDGLTTKPDGFVDASVVGTDGYVALDHTLVEDDLDTDAKVTEVEDDRYFPLLNEDVNEPDSKITLGRLWKWVLGKIKNLPTTITAFRTGDVIPVDGPSGTAKMSKDDLLKETAENAVDSGVAASANKTNLVVDFVYKSAKNIYDGSYVDGYFINPVKPSIQTNADYFISDYIKVNFKKGYVIPNYNGVGAGIEFLDEDKVRISAHGQSAFNAISVPSGTRYIRLSTKIIYRESAILAFSTLSVLNKLVNDSVFNEKYGIDLLTKRFVKADGTWGTDPYSTCSDYIEVKEGDEVKSEFSTNQYFTSIAFFDTDKTFVSTGASSDTQKIAPCDGYVVVSYYVGGGNPLQTDKHFFILRSSYNVPDEFDKIKNEVDVDKRTITELTKRFVKANGTWGADAYSTCSDYIAVNNGDTVKSEFSSNVYFTSIAFFDINKNFVSVGSSSDLQKTATCDGYVVISYYVGNGNPLQTDKFFTIYHNSFSFSKNVTQRFEKDENTFENFAYRRRTIEKKELASFNSGASISITAPDVKTHYTINARCEFTAFTSVSLSKGTSAYSLIGTEIVIDDTNVTIKKTTSESLAPIPHGLTISEFINIEVKVDGELKKATLVIATADNNVFSQEIYWTGNHGNVIFSSGSTASNARISFNNSALDYDLWFFGDSYVDMWPATMFNEFAVDKFLLDGHSGRASSGALSSFNKELENGCPKYVVWMLGMNDPDTGGVVNSDWKSAFDSVRNTCALKKITLYCTTIPNVPTRVNKYKNDYMKSCSDVIVVDVAEAVGASEIGASWYSNLLSADGVHPSSAGSAVIASVINAGVPL